MKWTRTWIPNTPHYNEVGLVGSYILTVSSLLDKATDTRPAGWIIREGDVAIASGAEQLTKDAQAAAERALTRHLLKLIGLIAEEPKGYHNE